METQSFDVAIIGMGLGAVAIARRMIGAGASVAMLPGAGRARFKHIDGGIVSSDLLQNAIGEIESSPVHRIGNETVFQRDELEAWAIDILGDAVAIIDSFEEARVLPAEQGQFAVTDLEASAGITARTVFLTEGANPKIGIAAGIRRDFPPQDMIHFARTRVESGITEGMSVGRWRTSWNMPATYMLVPQEIGVLVVVSVRIENVMRSGRDGRDTLADFLRSALAREHGLPAELGEMGIELMPILHDDHGVSLGLHDLVISPDANGIIDPRSPERYNNVLRAGIELGEAMAVAWPRLIDWDDAGAPQPGMFGPIARPYHDDRTTGFVEEGPGTRENLFRKLFSRSAQ